MNIKKNKSAILVLIIAFSWVVLAPAPALAADDTKKEAGLAAAIESPPISFEMEKESGSRVSRHRKFPWLLAIAGVAAVGLVVLYFWGTHEQWPQYADDPAIFTTVIEDPVNDQVLPAEGAPPQVNPYLPIDLKKVSLGVREGYFYIRVDVAGTIPNSVQKINGDKLKKQAFNLAVDSDNDPGSGPGEGFEIVFHVSFDYGWRSESPYASCEFSGPNVDSSTRKIGGERRSGGPGYNFFVFRYKISGLGDYFPRGNVVMLHPWSEVRSSQYHHFAFDKIQPLHWTIPL
jgi:hypothetical protein